MKDKMKLISFVAYRVLVHFTMLHAIDVALELFADQLFGHWSRKGEFAVVQ